MRIFTRFLPCVSAIALVFAAQSVVAQEAEQTGSVFIMQKNVDSPGILGSWDLIKPNNEKVQAEKKEFSLKTLPIGRYSLFVDPPEGAGTRITVLRNDKREGTYFQPQYIFTLQPDEHVDISIEYIFNRIGRISITSDPAGIEFTVNGPNGWSDSGITPKTYEGYPAGQYAVVYHAIEGCLKETYKTGQLENRGRTNINVTLKCEGLEQKIQPQSEKLSSYVNLTIDGQLVLFQDVPVDTWFAPYVHTAAKTGVLSGYRDENGSLSGQYGPNDPVTLNQLVKIAHEVAGIDESLAPNTPLHRDARGTWFAQYQSSAEKRHWEVFTDPALDFNRPATRAEVVATFLQAFRVPREWATGEMFTDVPLGTAYAHSIETAAADGLVAGFTDEIGNSTGAFGPEASVNRAEISKMVSQAIQLYIGDTPSPVQSVDN